MAIPLSVSAQAFIRAKVWANFATLIKDGSPQVTPVWVDTDGQLIINTAEGRQKTRNIRRDGHVATCIMSAESPYKYVLVRRKVKEVTTKDAEHHTNVLSHKYSGKDYPYSAGEVRVKVIIEPTHVTERGLTWPRPAHRSHSGPNVPNLFPTLSGETANI